MLGTSYTCRGQFADWPPAYSASAFTDNDDGTVTDSRSGLVWQQAVDAATYTWADATDYCTALKLAGEDWRLPTKAELESIVDDSRQKPAIDATAFPDTSTDTFWSASPYVGLSGAAWTVEFYVGQESHADIGKANRVRCVRSILPATPSAGSGGIPSGRYVDNRDGTVSDTRTKLTWQQVVLQGLSVSDSSTWTYTLPKAETYCLGLSLPGTGWRLPTRSELLTLVDPTKYNPAIDATTFPGTIETVMGDTPLTYYWSSSADANSSTGYDGWIVSFSDGSSLNQSKVNQYRVRCVRNGGASVDQHSGGAADAGGGTADASGSIDCVWEGGNSQHCRVCANDATCDAPKYTDNSDGTVTSSCCGLVWQQSVDTGTYDQEQAGSYCASLALAGGRWRLPTIEELLSLVVLGQTPVVPTIDRTAFPSASSSILWSSTASVNSSSYGWVVTFKDGTSYTIGLGGTYHVRCVR